MSEPLSLAFQQEGDGPAVMVLHGLYGSGNNWRGVTGELARHYHVIRPDLRNHGNSPHHPVMDYPTMAGDVMQLIERLALERVTLVGHSMGGKVAMALAQLTPARLAGLMVVDIAPVHYDHRQEHGRLIETLQALDLDAIDSRQAADRALTPAIPQPAIRQFLLTNLQRDKNGWSWRIPLAILGEQLPVIQSWPASLDHPWPGPACFLYGEASGYVQEGGQQAIERLFPNATRVGLPGVGHWVHAEAPDAFKNQLQSFLSHNNH
jgi:pimeloyl-ACP methyl ester carboxylesterase